MSWQTDWRTFLLWLWLVKTKSRLVEIPVSRRSKKSKGISVGFVFDAARLVYQIAREKLAKGKSERPPGDLPVGREYRPSCDNDLGERVSRLFARFTKRAVKKGNHPDTTDREKKRCLKHNCITCLREEQFTFIYIGILYNLTLVLIPKWMTYLSQARYRTIVRLCFKLLTFAIDDAMP